MSVMVVIPTYNEKENIKKLIPTVLNLPIEHEIEVLIVDDNSPDGTGEVVKKMARFDSRIHFLHRPKKLGLGTAYITGFKYALTHKHVRYLVQMDADFSHNPSVIPDFLAMMDDYDVVVGSRYINGLSVVNWPIRRLILSSIANLYAKLVTGLWLTDITTGYKCFQRDVLECIDLDDVRSVGYAFQIEMNYRATKSGFRIGETPIIFVDRHAGTSKMDRSLVYEALFIVWYLRLGLYKRT